jgi:hypothetical protein
MKTIVIVVIIVIIVICYLIYSNNHVESLTLLTTPNKTCISNAEKQYSICKKRGGDCFHNYASDLYECVDPSHIKNTCLDNCMQLIGMCLTAYPDDVEICTNMFNKCVSCGVVIQ